MQKPLSEQQILVALAGGKAPADDALRQLYFDNRAVIRAFVRENNGTEEEAKDVVQDAVIAFYENVKMGKFRGESAISTYLFSIARFMWLNRLKRKQLENNTLERTIHENAEPSLPQRITDRETRQHLADLFGRLQSGCQEVLMDALYHDFSMKEIAARMGYENEQVARNKKHGCMKKLKEMLAANPAMLDMLVNQADPYKIPEPGFRKIPGP